MLSTIVIAHDGLHALVHTHDEHKQHHHHRVGYGIGSYRHIATIAHELVVHEDDNHTGRDIHQERGNAYGNDVAHQHALQLIDSTFQVQQLLLVREEPHLPAQGQRLTGYRSQGGTTDSPAEPPYEEHDEHDVACHSKQGGVHRMARLPCCSQHGIHAKVHVRHHVAQQNDHHESTGIGKRNIRSTEETQNGVKEYQTHGHKQKADDEVQRHRIA